MLQFAERTCLATYGAPGSGKSHWSAPYVQRGWVHVNLDSIREKHKDVKKREHWNIADRMIADAVMRGKNIMCDNTHIFADQLERLAKPTTGYKRFIVYFNTPLEVCIERNMNRDRVVPAYVIEDYKFHMLSPIDVLRKNPLFDGLYLIDATGNVEFMVQRAQM